MRSDKRLKAWFREINTKFFDNEVRDDICVRWGLPEDDDEEKGWETRYNGYARKLCNDPFHYAEIVISNDLRKNYSIKLSVLLHEMVHCATDFRDEHGEAFDKWHKILVAKGAFRKNALLPGISLF